MKNRYYNLYFRRCGFNCLVSTNNRYR